NILRMKFNLGLFENPYKPEEQDGNLYSPDHLEKAKQAAIISSVLLKNKNNILPLNQNTKITITGPLADAPREQLGTWTFDGESEHSVTPVTAFKNKNVNFIPGLKYSRDKSTEGFKETIAAAKKADVIVFIGGEEAILSGEAHSRANIDLPGAQEQLIKELSKTGKPVVLVIMAGRPITVTNIIDNVDAVLMMWHPGTMGGPALYEMIYGEKEPGGRLPVTWPKTAGQLPLYYNHKNTGRPADSTFVHIDNIPVGAWQSSLGNNSHYLDAGYTPHFPFGYGLGYTHFEYSNLKISRDSINANEELQVNVIVKNSGNKDGDAVVQLYVQDVVGTITRPVKELKRFKRIYLKKGEEKEVTFSLKTKDLMFVNNTMKKVLEPGKFNLWVGPDSASGIKTTFYLKSGH